MGNRVYTLSVTTAGDGTGADAEALGRGMWQWLYAVQWVDGDFADGVDAVLSCLDPDGASVTLATLTDANADGWYYVGVAEAGQDGAALTTYRLPIVQGTLTLTIAAGGATKTGGCHVYTVD